MFDPSQVFVKLVRFAKYEWGEYNSKNTMAHFLGYFFV